MDSPAHIKRKIEQSFSVAATNLKEKSRVKHPSKRNVKLVDAYPLVPDLDAFPDSGAYVTFKFTNNPVPPSRTYDKRLLNGVLKPLNRSEEEEQAYQLALQAHERDPEHMPKPQNLMDYDYFLPDSVHTSDRFNQKFDVMNLEHDDESLYTHKNNGKGHFPMARVRTYETSQELELDNQTKYDEEVVLAFNDDEMLDQKAAFYYPIMQRSVIKPQRTKNIARTIGLVPADFDADENKIDQLDVRVEDPTDAIRAWMDLYREHPYGKDDEEEEAEAEVDADAEGEQDSGRVPSQQQYLAELDEDDDEDAEGEQDED